MSRKANHHPSRVCEKCGETFNRNRYNGTLETSTRYLKRRFCSQQCAKVDRSDPDYVPTERERNMVEDVKWIIGFDTPDNIARRVGYKHALYLIRALDKCFEHELANRLRREHSEYVAVVA